MKKSTLVALVVGAMVLLGLVVYFFRNSEEGNGPTYYQSTNWENKYGVYSKDAKGLYYFNTALKERFAKSKIIELSSENYLDSVLDKKEPALFVCISDTVTLQREQVEKILNHVRDLGSGLILFSEVTYDYLLKSISDSLEKSFYYSKSIEIYTPKNNFELYTLHQADTVYSPYYVINNPSASFSPITKVRNKSMVGKMDFGKGNIYLSACPKLFQNYQFLNPDGKAHARYVISKIAPYSQIYELSFAQLQWRDEYNWSDIEPEEKMQWLKIFYDNPILQKVLWVSLIGILLMVFFMGRRERSVIPIRVKSINVTQSYVSTISSIYRNHEKPSVAYNMLRNNFYSTIHRLYYSDVSKMEKEDQISWLAEKSTVDYKKVKFLIENLNQYDFVVEMSFVKSVALQTYEFMVEAGLNKPLRNPFRYPIVIKRNIWITFFLLLSAIVLSFTGLFLASKSYSGGGFIWAMGGVNFLFAILRLRIPYLEIKEHAIEFFGLLGKKEKVTLEYLQESDDFIAKKEKRSFRLFKFDILKKDWLELIYHVKNQKHGNE